MVVNRAENRSERNNGGKTEPKIDRIWTMVANISTENGSTEKWILEGSDLISTAMQQQTKEGGKDNFR